MKTRQQFARREFLKTTAGALSLFATATYVPPAIAETMEDGPPPVNRNPAQLRRLLDEMDAKGHQFWSVPRKDGEFLHFLVKATKARNVLEWAPPMGFRRFGWG
jgi:predicted O-methyltransferase YrrM